MKNNHVVINDGLFDKNTLYISGAVGGARTGSATITGNSVTVYGGTFKEAYALAGGRADRDDEITYMSSYVNGNTETVKGGTFSVPNTWFIGGVTSGTREVTADNNVADLGGNITLESPLIAGGYIETPSSYSPSSGRATGNTVILREGLS